MCGDCVEGLASGPADCCVGAAAFAFPSFPPSFLRFVRSLCSWAEGQFEKK